MIAREIFGIDLLIALSNKRLKWRASERNIAGSKLVESFDGSSVETEDAESG
jgi:hypothetical protein